MKLKRRSFIQAAGAIGAGALTGALHGCRGRGDPILENLARWTEGEETWRNSICRFCPGACGLKVRVIDGRAVQVLGNSLHPVNRGGICPRGSASLEILHDPDRLTHPLRRQGDRGSGRWQSIAWEDALDFLSERLADLRSKGTPERLVVLDGQGWGLGERVLSRFARAFGTPNYIRYGPLEPELISLTHALMQGGSAPLGYDLPRCSYILCFGTGLLESWISPVSQMRAIAELRSGQGGARGRVVVVDPRLSVTAARSDLWVPVRPGTEGALALGIAYVIIRESLYDKAFIEKHAFGFEDWIDEAGRPRMGFKTLVLSEYNPLSVSEITGVRTERILTLAREFASAKPALAIGEPEFSWGPNDFYARMAIHSLNALTGNLVGSGTFAVQGNPPTSSLPEPTLDETARRGLARPRVDGAGAGVHLLSRDAVQALPRRIAARDPYPVDLLVLVQANPLFSHPAKEELASALANVGLMVSIGPYLDESAELSDLVLPEASFLERWDLVEARQHAGFSLVSIAEPVVLPLPEARDGADMILATAARLGGAIAASLPWRTSEEVLRHLSRGLFDAERGYVVSSPMEESFRRILERQGFRDPEFSSFEEFWEALRARGAWWDPTDTANDASALIRTESGRFEFYSRRLERIFRSSSPRGASEGSPLAGGSVERLRSELGIHGAGDRLFLPHHEPLPKGTERADFPLQLRPYLLLSLGLGETANAAWIQEDLAVQAPATWGSWVELNPLTAAELGIRDGDPVWVESPKGRLRTRARLFEGILPGVIAMPLGQGHRALGMNARGRGANPLDLVENAPDSRAGMAVLGLTPARIRPV